ncbi:MAG: hypothetical protein GXO62_03410 [Epsilonproteobacteria bacterium]|nr:hypothetical protein [Campylobacterota bacterium]
MNRLFFFFFATFLFADYTIQAFYSKDYQQALRAYNLLPPEIAKHCFITKNKLYALRCYKSKNKNLPLNKIKKYFKDAYILKKSKLHIIYPKKENFITIQKRIPLSTLLYKADKYYREGDYLKSLFYYKQAYSIHPSPQIATNISYIEGLIGKKPSIITEKNLYAYAIGALKTSKNIAPILKKHLNISKNGYLYLLYGYINERNPKEALKYYKLALDKNRYNKYFIYAYARALDINNLKKEAIYYYKEISQCKEKICKYAKERIKELLR